MINAAATGGGSVAFPAAPKGSPGEIAATVRTLANAADDLEHAHGALRGSSSTLESDWQGYAAAAYHSSSQGLAAVARGGADTFRECAHALTGYASALDHAQSEIRRLRTLYDDAVRRQVAANDLAGRLVGALTPHTKPPQATRLQGQATTAERQATDAGVEADGYARRATAVLDAFTSAAGRYEQTLNGVQPGQSASPLGSPFSPMGRPGPGFGAPLSNFTLSGANPGAGGPVPGGLDAYNGVIPVGDPWNSPIPGYGYHMDATTPEAVPTGDLTNLVVFLASFGAAGATRDLGGAALRSLAEALGIGGAGREVATSAGLHATEKAINEVFASGAARSESLPKLLAEARNVGRLAQAETQVGQGEVRATLGEHLLDVLDHVRPLPPGVKAGLGEILHRGPAYLTAAVSRLVSLQSTLTGSGTAAGRAAAQVIGVILRTMGR